MCLYLYLCMCIFLNVFVCVCVTVCGVFMHKCMLLYMLMYLYAHISLYTWICQPVCGCLVHVFISIQVCVCVYLSVCLLTHLVVICMNIWRIIKKCCWILWEKYPTADTNILRLVTYVVFLTRFIAIRYLILNSIYICLSIFTIG